MKNMALTNFTLEQLGDKIWIFFEGPPSSSLTHIITNVCTLIEQQGKPFIECVPCADSILVYGNTFTHAEIENYISLSSNFPIHDFKEHIIYVCYEDEFATDLDFVLDHYGMNKTNFIKFQSDISFYVAFNGFMPGFCYLCCDQDLPIIPRKDMASNFIQRGSVGLAAKYCGIYPSECPGGWQIIGKSSFRNFNLNTSSFVLSPGDKVRFKPIKKEYLI
jgi:KipI family sensor histidine kinase inhibitor